MKGRPDACPECGSNWDMTDGSMQSYRDLGSFVWQCRDCMTVSKNSDPHRRSVVRR